MLTDIEAEFQKAQETLGLVNDASVPINGSTWQVMLTANTIREPALNPRKRRKIQYAASIVMTKNTFYQRVDELPDQAGYSRSGTPPTKACASVDGGDNASSTAAVCSIEFGNILPSSSPTKSCQKYQSHSEKRRATSLKWRALLPTLLPQYATLVANRSAIPLDIPGNHTPTMCTTTNCRQSASVLKVLCIYRMCK